MATEADEAALATVAALRARIDALIFESSPEHSVSSALALADAAVEGLGDLDHLDSLCADGAAKLNLAAKVHLSVGSPESVQRVLALTATVLEHDDSNVEALYRHSLAAVQCGNLMEGFACMQQAESLDADAIFREPWRPSGSEEWRVRDASRLVRQVVQRAIAQMQQGGRRDRPWEEDEEEEGAEEDVDEDEDEDGGRSCAEPSPRLLCALRGRETTARWSPQRCAEIAARPTWLPRYSSGALTVSEERVFNGQFSVDGSTFRCTSQDHKIRIYDSRNTSRFVQTKTIEAQNMRWTVTDTDLCPDQRFIVYSTMNPVLHLANVTGDYELHEAMDLSVQDDSGGFAVFSVSFLAGSGREVVAGGSNGVLKIYNTERKQTVVSVASDHRDDINAVCFLDSSSNVFASASDDSLCKVWDRRLLDGSGGRPVSVLVGHTEGLTSVSSRGDGLHLITNSKDQTLKLWDLRTAHSGDAVPGSVYQPSLRYRHTGWDYRTGGNYPGRADGHTHPDDRSVLTCRGHYVLRTLIRCYFSPARTTNQRYAITGCASGRVHYYDLVTGEAHRTDRGGPHDDVVRDVTWHPSEPFVVSSSWDGSLAFWRVGPTGSLRN